MAIGGVAVNVGGEEERGAERAMRKGHPATRQGRQPPRRMEATIAWGVGGAKGRAVCPHPGAPGEDSQAPLAKCNIWVAFLQAALPLSNRWTTRPRGMPEAANR